MVSSEPMGATRKHILLVDDEPDVLDLVESFLARNGSFAVSRARDGVEALTKARAEMPALVVLDLMMPKMSGIELCKLLKAHPATRAVPIIMLTAKADEVDRILGLELGADDYVTKPFSPRELALRINAILRRGAPATFDQHLVVGPVTVDLERHRVSVSGEPITLTAVEFRLLATLMQRPGRVHARDRLLSEVWGYETMIDTRTVDTHVRRLRDKLGKAANLIETIRGFGYRIGER